eukprot:CAMPEP_0201527210 /NCGR_PEP_ID=MMETSP0161_2-20130828/34405_1 /ASSEMBLY_ACC=CAM_ASM_000251 /TAXON_ID=180227 /ORGANISM="Neoparamoeba aestuarina, Strain SoJaBio B1-5/56/2" /LENGTH=55 /DNA_ID=CAMNT_0047927939 /DNA_START=359 /DNA_END=526 /DNA_ORIENTATION=-
MTSKKGELLGSKVFASFVPLHVENKDKNAKSDVFQEEVFSHLSTPLEKTTMIPPL